MSWGHFKDDLNPYSHPKYRNLRYTSAKSVTNVAQDSMMQHEAAQSEHLEQIRQRRETPDG